MMDKWIDTVRHGDCVKLMAQLPPKSIDLIATDPPAELSPRGKIQGDARWLAEAFKVLKTGRVCYVIGSEATMQRFTNDLGSSGFRLIKTIIWKHPDAPIYKWTPIFLLSKGEPEVGLPISDVWNYEVVPIKARITGAQKPIELMEHMISLSSNPGEIVLDPFLGVGTTAVACKRLNRHCIGMEIIGDRCKIIRDRLAQVVA